MFLPVPLTPGGLRRISHLGQRANFAGAKAAGPSQNAAPMPIAPECTVSEHKDRDTSVRDLVAAKATVRLFVCDPC